MTKKSTSPFLSQCADGSTTTKQVKMFSSSFVVLESLIHFIELVRLNDSCKWTGSKTTHQFIWVHDFFFFIYSFVTVFWLLLDVSCVNVTFYLKCNAVDPDWDCFWADQYLLMIHNITSPYQFSADFIYLFFKFCNIGWYLIFTCACSFPLLLH